MPRLSDLTDRTKVQEVIDEVLAPGGIALLEPYSRSKDYFILTPSGQLLDSKPILSLAYERQFPNQQLPVASFSGGEKGAAKTLRAMNFEVVTRAQHSPPKLGSTYQNRTEVQAAFGGDKFHGIIRFPGENVVNVFSDARGPYADELPNAIESFGYRGAGLEGDQKLESSGNQYLEASRLRREAVRYWHKPFGEPFTFVTWAVVVDRGWTRGRDRTGAQRLEIEWVLQPVKSQLLDDLPEDVTLAIEEAAETAKPLPEKLEVREDPSYADLYEGTLDREATPKRRHVRQDHVRSLRARRAVLLRSGGSCEGPGCTGVPAELNRAGEPILDVDHIVDLALGGADSPLNMIALCPNCHAVKTRGKRSQERVRRLLAVARAAHLRALSLED